MPEHQQTQRSTESKTTSQKQATPQIKAPISNPMIIIQCARINPKSLTQADVLQLQRTIGNRAVGRLLSEVGLIPSKVKQVSPVQRQELVQRQEILEEEEPLQGKFENKPEEETCPSCMQRQEIPEEEEPLQGKVIGAVQRQEIPEEEEPLQTKRENNTGMPDNLKAGVENLSGIDMSNVRVHYNSDKPAEVGALAYTQGTNIHVAPGQEKHLSHEAWHVVQQKQGRVQVTMQLKDVVVNDDEGLEQEADAMGATAMQMRRSETSTSAFPINPEQKQKQGWGKEVFGVKPPIQMARKPFGECKPWEGNWVQGTHNMSSIIKRLSQDPSGSQTPEIGNYAEDMIINSFIQKGGNGEYGIPNASKQKTGYMGFADLENEGGLLEIKSFNNRVLGNEEVTNYVNIANQNPNKPRKFRVGEFELNGRVFVAKILREELPKNVYEIYPGGLDMYLVWNSVGGGVVTYEWEFSEVQTQSSDECAEQVQAKKVISSAETSLKFAKFAAWDAIVAYPEAATRCTKIAHELIQTVSAALPHYPYEQASRAQVALSYLYLCTINTEATRENYVLIPEYIAQISVALGVE